MLVQRCSRLNAVLLTFQRFQASRAGTGMRPQEWPSPVRVEWNVVFGLIWYTIEEPSSMAFSPGSSA